MLLVSQGNCLSKNESYYRRRCRVSTWKLCRFEENFHNKLYFDSKGNVTPFPRSLVVKVCGYLFASTCSDRVFSMTFESLMALLPVYMIFIVLLYQI